MKFTLSREAKLFDSRLFILKVFLCLFTGYVLFNGHVEIGKDMISLLFGIMLALEPVSVSGIRSGFSQIKASIIGGVISAIIIFIGGINYITVPLAVAVTIYITLVLDWKNLSIIAIFTAIYMTQYIQYNIFNEPSVLLTLRLRMSAVFTGVFIAIIYNTLFSKLFYKSLVKKRTIYLFEKHIENMKDYSLSLKNESYMNSLKFEISHLFNFIDMIHGNIVDLRKEKKQSKFLETFEEINRELRNTNHFYMDIVINGELIDENVFDLIISNYKKIVEFLENNVEIEIVELENISNENIMKICNSLKNIVKLLEGDIYE